MKTYYIMTCYLGLRNCIYITHSIKKNLICKLLLHFVDRKYDNTSHMINRQYLLHNLDQALRLNLWYLFCKQSECTYVFSHFFMFWHLQRLLSCPPCIPRAHTHTLTFLWIFICIREEARMCPCLSIKNAWLLTFPSSRSLHNHLVILQTHRQTWRQGHPFWMQSLLPNL